MRNRIEEIKKKGFSLPLANQDDTANESNSYVNTDFSKIRVGIKTLEDATIDVNIYKKIHPHLGSKEAILRSIYAGNLPQMREISDFFYKTSGIYSRLCRYMAYLYRYDWMITPYINGGLGVVRDADVKLPKNNRDKILENFFKALKYFDDFEVKNFLGEVALKVIKYGCYYGYKTIDNNGKINIQELPPKYCRSRFKVNGQPVVEFNMAFFDTIRDEALRKEILDTYPKIIFKAYRKYKFHNGPKWIFLPAEMGIYFSYFEERPFFLDLIPLLDDLDDYKDIDKERNM